MSFAVNFELNPKPEGIDSKGTGAGEAKIADKKVASSKV